MATRGSKSPRKTPLVLFEPSVAIRFFSEGPLSRFPEHSLRKAAFSSMYSVRSVGNLSLESSALLFFHEPITYPRFRFEMTRPMRLRFDFLPQMRHVHAEVVRV